MASETSRPLLLPQNRKLRHLRGVYLRNLTLSRPRGRTIDDAALNKTPQKLEALREPQLHHAQSSGDLRPPKLRRRSTVWSGASPGFRQKKLEDVIDSRMADTFFSLHCEGQEDPIYISEVVEKAMNPTFRFFDLSGFGPATTRLDTEESQPSSIPETQDIGILRDERLPDGPDCNVAPGDGAVGDLNFPDTLSPSAEIDSTSRLRRWRKKMESTQASTQSNVGRSYDQYCRPLSPNQTSSSAEPPRSSPPNHRDTDDDCLGTAKAIIDDEDDSGFVNLFRHGAPQKTVLSPTQHSPKTPTPTQNPFRHSRSELLPTSQLFQSTQFSSPVKLASPTSSRPGGSSRRRASRTSA